MKITKIQTSFVFLLLSFVPITGFSQQPDTLPTKTTFSGTVGITNNGFAIIPTFSLNSPAVIMNYYVRRKRFSFDPDIRLVPDASKGGMLFWFRYYAIERSKFSLRLGVHPAFSYIRRTVTDNGTQTQITEMLRFAAGEIVPNYQITPNWSIGAVYLHGEGLQKHGPQRTDVLFLNTNIGNIPLGKALELRFIPMVYFLNTDHYIGNYFSATGIISHKKSPFSLQATVNQTFTSDIPGNQDFMWNVTLNYSFSKQFVNVP
jgi:hypothetical protein